jgi:hypothetical protein
MAVFKYATYVRQEARGEFSLDFTEEQALARGRFQKFLG